MNSDDDCMGDLLCWNRQSEEMVVPPTCNQTDPLIPEDDPGRNSVDYCYECPAGSHCLKNLGSNGCGNAPCSLCEGTWEYGCVNI